MKINEIFDDIIHASESACDFDYAYICGSCVTKHPFGNFSIESSGCDGIVCGVAECSNSDESVQLINLPTINGANVITLFHGTTSENAQNITSNGFRPQTCLTTDMEIAQYYAECACDAENLNYDDVVILSVSLTKDCLVVDYAAYEEPLSYYRDNFTKCDKEWGAMCDSGKIPYPSDQNDVDSAIQATCCVRLAVWAPATPDNIEHRK